MLKKSIDAMMETDCDMAREVCLADDEVDDMKNEIREKVVIAMKKHPDQVRQYLGFMGIARSLERIADLSSNIAEDCIYLCQGAIVRHKGWEELS
jgi:phosphate transport system protein